tara:strand:- start:184 stop:705 length:522 start_codon:yes stop_codon:yes gene_type:complete
MKKTLAIDMDNVLVNIEENWINWYEREFGVRVSKEAMLGVNEDEAFPDKAAARSLLYKPGFFLNAPIIAGAHDALLELKKEYEIYIVSAAMEFPNSLIEKHDWLKNNLPFISWRNIVLCGDKSIIGTDLLIDDHVKNLDFFKGESILYTAGHNIHIDRYTRVNNWEEVLKLLL